MVQENISELQYLQKFNEKNQFIKNEFSRVLKVTALQIGTYYKLIKIYSMETKFSDKTSIVTIEMEDGDEKEFFLPSRFSDIEEIYNPKDLYLIYKGKDGGSNVVELIQY